MKDLSVVRRKIGMSQFTCARMSGVSRMRISLAETGQVSLSEAEERAVRQAFHDFVTGKTKEMSRILYEQEQTPMQAIAG